MVSRSEVGHNGECRPVALTKYGLAPPQGVFEHRDSLLELSRRDVGATEAQFEVERIQVLLAAASLNKFERPAQLFDRFGGFADAPICITNGLAHVCLDV